MVPERRSRQKRGRSLVGPPVPPCGEQAGFDRARLVLEITETAAMEDLARAHSTMLACRALGVRFAIHDFGTGHASLTNVREQPVDRIKIDRSFVSRLPEVAGDRAVGAPSWRWRGCADSNQPG
ncbi:MAG: EAL domain-containing protein [Pseudomonadales bacterium]|nr:EAL domain-containing protein [Pseudomonadales bacterium]